MNGNDMRALRQAFALHHLFTALALLTRLPLPAAAFAGPEKRVTADAAWAYPLVGGIVAVIALGVGMIAAALSLPASLQAVFVVASCAVLTGAMHEDGLADSADGFWGGWTHERRLEIMKDSQIGTYGVIALVVSLILRWQAVMLLIGADMLAMALFPAAMMSRTAMVWVMYRLPHARDNGLSRQTGKPPRAALAAALTIGGLAALLSGAVLAVAVAGIAVTLAAGALARAKIGGQTGDVLGATQQLVDIAILLTFAALLA